MKNILKMFASSLLAMALVSTVEAGRFEEKITPEEVQEVMEAVEIAEVLAPAVESGVRAVKEAAERGEMPPAGMTKQGWADWLKSKGSSAWASTKSGLSTAKEKASALKQKYWTEKSAKERAQEALIAAAAVAAAGAVAGGAAKAGKAYRAQSGTYGEKFGAAGGALKQYPSQVLAGVQGLPGQAKGYAQQVPQYIPGTEAYKTRKTAKQEAKEKAAWSYGSGSAESLKTE